MADKKEKKYVSDNAQLMAEWNWEKNEKLGFNPYHMAQRSNKKTWWKCKNGHEWEATIDHRNSGQGCPFCSNKSLLYGYNDLETRYPNIANEWDFTRNVGSPKDYTYRSTYKAFWKCAICGYEWRAKIQDRVDSKWKMCPKCVSRKIGELRHNHELKKRGGITNQLLLSEWDYKRNKKGPEEYTSNSGAKVFWICSKCGHNFKATINNRTNRNGGCACCSGKTVVKGINDLFTTHPQLASEWHPTKNGELKATDVSFGMARKIWWMCPNGHEYQATINHRSGGTNCPICNSGRQTSFAEQAVYYYVKKIFPDAISRFTDIFDNSMELDIYIPTIKTAIEYDGEAWHKSDKIEREIKKYKICQKNGIKLIRLKEKSSDNDKYTSDMCLGIEGNMYEHKQLAKVIRTLIDMLDPESNMWTRKNLLSFHSKIDINIERDEMDIRSYMTKYSMTSFSDIKPDLVKEWDTVKNGKLSPDKVKPYAKIKVWWICSTCKNEYKASVAHRVGGTGCPKCAILKNAKRCSKKVIMLDPVTRTPIRIFDSISEAGKTLGINSSNITSVCKHIRPKAGGYAWEYYNDDSLLEN